MSQEGIQSSPKRGIRWPWVISGLVVLVVCGGIALRALEGAFAYYMTADEFVERREDFVGKRVKVAGHVQEGSLVADLGRYEFTVEYSGKSFPVRFDGIPPDTFKEGVEVVIEGRASEEDLFLAQTLMAKCASKYEAGQLPPLEEQSTPYTY